MTLLLTPAQRQSTYLWNSYVQEAMGVPPAPPRLVDFVISRREVPVRVICLGLSRTGSFSIFNAFKMLGYNPYHFGAAMPDAPVALPCLQQAIEATYFGKGQPWGKEEFDKILGRHDVLVEVPSNVLAKDILAAYPDAHVIIHDRPVEGWIKSMSNTITEVMLWKIWPFIAWADPTFVGAWWNFMNVLDKVQHFRDCRLNPAAATKFFNNHYAEMRELCKDRKNVLEFRPQHGWEPFCKFLDQPVPDTPFPNLNEAQLFIHVHKNMARYAAKEAAKKIVGASVVVSVLALWAWQFRASGKSVFDMVKGSLQGP